MLRKLFKNTSIYVLSDFLVKSSTIILTPYLLIKLSTVEFGQFGLITATVGLGHLVYNFGFQSGYTRFYYLRKDHIGEYVSSSTIFLLTFALVLIPLVSLILLKLDVFIDEIRFVELLVINVSALLFSIFVNNGITLLKVKDEPLKSGLLGFGTTFSILLFIILLLESSALLPLRAIVYGQIIGVIIGVLLSIFLNKELLSSKISFSYFKEIFRYSLPLLPHNISQWGIASSDRFIIAKILGPEALGGYYFAIQFANATKMIFRAVNSSMLNYYSKSVTGDVSSNVIYKINKLYSIFILAIAFLLPYLIVFLLDYINYDKFKEYHNLIFILICASSIYGLYMIPMNHISIVEGKTNKVYLSSLTALFFSLFFNLGYSNLGVMIPAIASVGACTIMLVGIYILSRKKNFGNYYSELGLVTVLGILLINVAFQSL